MPAGSGVSLCEHPRRRPHGSAHREPRHLGDEDREQTSSRIAGIIGLFLPRLGPGQLRAALLGSLFGLGPGVLGPMPSGFTPVFSPSAGDGLKRLQFQCLPCVHHVADADPKSKKPLCPWQKPLTEAPPKSDHP
jgi:hypothetical protein